MPFQVSDPIGSLAWAFLALQVLLVWGAWRSRAALEAGEELPPPGVLYSSVILQGLLLLAFALAAAWDAGIQLRPAGQSAARALLWAPPALLLMLATVLPVWRLTPPEERARRAQMLPRNPRERALALAVSLVAGVGEELVWRAVLPALLVHLTGSLVLAIGLSVLSFSLAHWMQGGLAMAAVLVFALLFHGLVALTGGLVAAVAVHALYDAAVSVWIGPLLHRRSG
jgi:membrane protease YdiL (CAAX protease family)